jgi:DNA-binding XRE family transcriptional regulator
MVNTEEFTNRLNQIMEYYDLSAASFADKIDVGRSSISHLLSGRNKPSLDFVMKIITAFPEVELYWLLNGKGNFPKKGSDRPGEEKIPQASQVQDLFTTAPLPKESAPNSPGFGKPGFGKEIQKIVILYKDGSFEAYEN